MRLISDKRCRIQCRDLLKANTPYDAEIGPGGSIILKELVPKQVERARLVRRGGRSYLESTHPVTTEDVAAIVSQFP